MQRRKRKYILGSVLCMTMVLMASMMVYAGGSGPSVGFDFCISSTAAGYSSVPVKKTGAVDAAYASLTENGYTTTTLWFIKVHHDMTTAFIVTKSTGAQLSEESVVKGTGNATPVYNVTGKNYLGDVCIRANTAIVPMPCDEYTVSGTFYPNGS